MKRTKYEIELLSELILDELKEKSKVISDEKLKQIKEHYKQKKYENTRVAIVEAEKKIEQAEKDLDTLREKLKKEGIAFSICSTFNDPDNNPLWNHCVKKFHNPKLPKIKEIEKQVLLSTDEGADIIVKKIVDKLSK